MHSTEAQIDIAIMRALSQERSKNFQSIVLLRDPVVAVLPRSRKLKKKKIQLADLANERFVLFHRQGARVSSTPSLEPAGLKAFSSGRERTKLDADHPFSRRGGGRSGDRARFHEQSPVGWSAVRSTYTG